MGAQKKRSSAVTDPIQLLESLSHSLLEHLREALEVAQKKAEKALADIEKRRAKIQAKLQDGQENLKQALQAGKAKRQAKVQALIADLEQQLIELKAGQKQLLGEVAKLKRDSKQSLTLAKGIEKVKVAAGGALEKRQKAVQEVIEPAAKKPSIPRARTPAKTAVTVKASGAAGQAEVAAPSTSRVAPKPAPKTAAKKAVVRGTSAKAGAASSAAKPRPRRAPTAKKTAPDQVATESSTDQERLSPAEKKN